MAKQIILTKADEDVISQLAKTVGENLPYHKSRYRASMLQEFEYLIAEGFYANIAEAIAEDLFFSNELYKGKATKGVLDSDITPKRKAS